MPGREAVSGCPLSGWSWLADLGEGVNCFVFYLLKIHGDCKNKNDNNIKAAFNKLRDPQCCSGC